MADRALSMSIPDTGIAAHTNNGERSIARAATTQAGPTPPAAPGGVRETVSSAGAPLDTATRSFFEPRFGTDFSQVRIHNDSRAAESADSIQAKAYTFGDDVVFAAGQYAPGTGEGRRLLAHELAHTVQQRGTSRKSIQRQSIHNPLFPCYETAVMPGGMDFFGTLVHLAIQQHYVSEIDPMAATEYVIPGSGPSGGLGRADIVSSIGGIYEIKPVGLAVDGFLEATNYLAQAEVHCDPHMPWHLGLIYWAPPLTVGDFTVVSWLEGPGLILYALRRRERRRVPERQPVTSPERRTSPVTQPVPVPLPTPTPTPVTTPTPSTPTTVPVRQPQSTGQKIAEWARRVYEQGQDATQAAEQFLRENPGLAGVVAAAGIVGIIALIADDATIAGIVDDVLVPIIAALEWVALRMSLGFA